MTACHYLEGENLAPLTAAKVRALVGHRIEYLRERDIDRSGRGYYWPRKGVVLGGMGRNIELDQEGNFESFGRFVEVVDLGVAELEGRA